MTAPESHDAAALHVAFRLPWMGPEGECDNFFAGIWHPGRALQLDFPPTGVPCKWQQGRNWFLVSATSALHGPSAGLIHASQAAARAVAFRGYVCNANIHSYSAGEDILAYWRTPLAEHNGVFSAALIDDQAGTLTLVSDVFGMSPLYYASIGEAIVFSTNPRYLPNGADAPDMIAWRCLLETGFVAADRSLNAAVRRVPAGKALQVSRHGKSFVSWLPLDRLPHGERPLDAGGVREVEATFQQAMDRCLGLKDLRVTLPLSSGHDSRRMLAALVERRTQFKALTCRVYHGFRDLDARYSAEMARDFGFDHAIVEPPDAAGYALHDRVKRNLVDAETGMHSWAISLMAALPKEPGMFFDGIAGDILGNPGFRLPTLYGSPQQDIEIIGNVSVTGAFDAVLRTSQWPSAAEVRHDLENYLATLPQAVNLAEFAFILMRQRRATALWSQQLLPAGHVPVCPFLDLDYVKLLLQFRPQDKHAAILQAKCLAEFWPQYRKYPGTRDIPAGLQRGSPKSDHDGTLQCRRVLLEEIDSHGGSSLLKSMLSRRALVTLGGASLNRALALRTSWQFSSLMELVSRQVRSTPCWQLH